MWRMRSQRQRALARDQRVERQAVDVLHRVVQQAVRVWP